MDRLPSFSRWRRHKIPLLDGSALLKLRATTPDMTTSIAIRLGTATYAGIIASGTALTPGEIIVHLLPQHAESLHDVASTFGRGISCEGTDKQGGKWQLCVLSSFPYPNDYYIEVRFRASKAE